jgi:hypothetical protein
VKKLQAVREKYAVRLQPQCFQELMQMLLAILLIDVKTFDMSLLLRFSSLATYKGRNKKCSPEKTPYTAK